MVARPFCTCIDIQSNTGPRIAPRRPCIKTMSPKWQKCTNLSPDSQLRLNTVNCFIRFKYEWLPQRKDFKFESTKMAFLRSPIPVIKVIKSNNLLAHKSPEKKRNLSNNSWVKWCWVLLERSHLKNIWCVNLETYTITSLLYHQNIFRTKFVKVLDR